MSADAFFDDLKDQLDAAADDADVARELAFWAHQVSEMSELAALLRRGLAVRPHLAASLMAFRRRMPDAIASADEVRGGELLRRWERLFPSLNLDRRLAEMTVDDLAEAMGAPVPPGVDPETPLGELPFRRVFQFVTVRTYVDYVAALVRHRAAEADVVVDPAPCS